MSVTATGATNKALLIVYVFEFQLFTDTDKGFLEVKKEGANEQHKSIIGPLRAAATMCECEQINFAVSNRESVVESDFYTKFQKV